MIEFMCFKKNKGFFKTSVILVSLLILFMIILLSIIFFKKENRMDILKKNSEAIYNKINTEYFTRYREVIVKITDNKEIIDFLLKGGERKSVDTIVNVVKNTFDVSIVYVMDIKGNVLVSTKYDEENSLEGNNYFFRPYFFNAVDGEDYVYAATGVTTGERGIYFSSPVKKDDKVIGVVVIKASVTVLENIINKYSEESALISPEGVVFVSSRKEWLYYSVRKISQKIRSEIDSSLQYAGYKIEEFQWKFTDNTVDTGQESLLFTRKKIEPLDFFLYVFTPYDIKIPLTLTQYNLVIIISILLAGLFLIIYFLLLSIEKRKEYESLLKSDEKRFRNIIDNTDEGFILVDSFGIIKMINDKMKDIFGKEFVEFTNRSIIDFFEKENKELFQRFFAQKEKNRVTIFDIELKKENGKLNCLFNIVPLIDENDNLEGFFAFVTDVTKMKKAEEEVKNINQELEQRVNERTFELMHSLEELKNTRNTLEKNIDKLKKDEEAGKSLQQKLLPPSFKRIGDYNFFNIFIPSMFLSGDFLDYFIIDKRYTAFYIADVSGHGISSAFVTIWLKSFIENAVFNYISGFDKSIINPAEFLLKINDSIRKEKFGKHIAIFFGVIDNDNNELVFSNSGQFPYPVIKTADDIIVLESKGMPVGLMPNPNYNNNFISILKDFLFIAFSDGILEILPQDSLQRKEMFLKDLIASEGFNINSLITKCGLINLKSLPDDITFLIIRKGGHDYVK